MLAYIAPLRDHVLTGAQRTRPSTDHIGTDVHTKESQIRILTEGGELLAQRIRTEPERFATVLGTHFNHPSVGRIGPLHHASDRGAG
jgi:hypothetical protein